MLTQHYHLQPLARSFRIVAVFFWRRIFAFSCSALISAPVAGRPFGPASGVMIAVAILFQSFEPIGIDGFLGKAGQLGQEFMSDLGENLLGLFGSVSPTTRCA